VKERKARWRFRAPNRVKLCPVCLSPLKPLPLTGYILPEEYYCPKCGYRGHVALELVEEDEE